MNAAETSATLEAMLAPLLHLSPAERLEAIARLAQSLKKPEAVALASDTITLPPFVGAWTDDPEADKMEQAIRQNRIFAEKPELTQWP